MMIKCNKWGRKYLVRNPEDLTLEQVYEINDETDLIFSIEDGKLYCIITWDK